MHSKTVSIGADEYNGPEKDYKVFVNDMNDFIGEQSGKKVRIWGTFPKKDGEAETINQNVSMQSWSYSFDNPLYDNINNGYETVNSEDSWYVVIKYGAYSRKLDSSKTFDGDPEHQGPWYPNIFNVNNASDNVAHDKPLVRGAIQPIWNDHGHNTSVYSEAYYVAKDGIPALADKHWGGNLTKAQFSDVFNKLLPNNPGQNLERTVKSEGNTIFKYDFSSYSSGDIKDGSPNGYHPVTT